MQMQKIASNRTYSAIGWSLRVLAAAACLWPAVAAAQQSWNPTASDDNNNTAAGSFVLQDHTSGSDNTAIGYAALFLNTIGFRNTASGASALNSNTSGKYNTASGFSALQANTTGSYNTASGVSALGPNTTGHNNTAIGYEALFGNTTGSNNVAIGAGAGSATKGGSNNIYVGNPGATTESRVTRIGRVQTKTFIAGIAGVPLSGATVVIRANGQLGVVKSSARYKQDVKPLNASGELTEKLARLRPVSFRYKTEPNPTHYGLIAEEVDKVMPELVVRDEQNRPDSVQYMELVPLLLQQWKAQQAENVRLHTLIAQQQDRLMRQEAALAELRRTLATRLAALDGASIAGETGRR